MSISVLISVYKSERCHIFERALLSIWDWQTMKPTQIILIEDGPLTEELYDVISRWKRKLGDVLCIHKNPENIGLTKSLNKGLQFVTGDFIARMDSDDMSDPLRFERQYEYLIQNRDIDVLGGAMNEFSGKVIWGEAGFEILSPSQSIRAYPCESSSIRKYICKASPLCHGTVMMRTSLFRELGLRYNELYRTSQDINLWFDVISKGGRIANLPDVLYYMEVEECISRRSRRKAWNEFQIYMRGIWNLHGVTYRYAYPLSRLIFRLLPECVIRFIYKSSLRRMLLQGKNR